MNTYKNKKNPGFSFSFPSIFAFLVIACILFSPNMASAVQVTLAWDANSEPELAGYRAFLRQEGQNYNLDNPAWEGTETTCTIFDLDENISYYFVVRAYNTSGLESGNSNEVVYQSDYSAPPTANAGPDQTVYEEDTVILNGSNSSDPDDDIAFYHWNQVTGTQVVLSDTEVVRPTFIAPDVEGPGGQFLTFQLAVTDESGLTSTDTCIVVVNNVDTYPSMRVTAGQLVLYSFEEGSGTRVYDVSGFGTPLDLIVDDETAISWIAGGGLEIKSSTVIKSAGAARKVIDAVKASDELSIEAWITPANTTQGGPARIVTLSRDPSYRNFTLGQQSDTYDVRLRTTETSYNGIPSLRASYGSLTNQLTHVVYTRDVYGAINLYMDGALVVSGTAGGDCSVWDDYTLVLANELTGDRPWLGTYHMVAIFDRALDQAGVLQNFAAGPGVAADVPPEEEPNTDPDIVIDTDEDGIPDQDEIDLYGTNPNQADTDGDGINDGEELDYWVDRWGEDDDGDGLINLLDKDSDNDSFSDGLEIAQGYDPSDPSSKPNSGSEVTTVEVRVSAGSDDAEETASGGIYLTSTDLELVYDDYNGADNQKVGIRFTGVDIPRGATIVNAYVQFQVDETSSVATSLTVAGEDIDDAETFTYTRRDISSRVRTTANVPWSPVAWSTVGEAGPNQRTPDVSQIIQEIVARPGWSSGNSLAVIITGTGERVAESYNGYRGGAPLLHVEYTTSVAPEEDPDIVIDTDEDGIPDQDEIDLYGTNPNQADTDGDGINDGEELDYWVDRWGEDDDGDGLINLLDKDSDNDSFSDGLEIDQGYDPSDPGSKPGSGSEVTTVEVRVSASSDDAEERASGSMRLTSTDLELVYDHSDQTVGIRFNGVDIPQGASIVNAYVQFQVDETSSVATSLTVEGEDIDDAETFITSTSRDISSRVRTTANVPWSPVAWNTVGQAGPDQRTPDVSQIIEEIVGRPGWSSGNSLVVIITGTGERVAESYNGDLGGAPLLHVEYYTTDVAPEEEPITDPDIDLDTDEDGITDQDEIDLYGTNPNEADTDGDGINDGEELVYWMDRWDADDDGDGLINLLDEDSDNDGFSDSIEVAQGYDPSDPSSNPSSGSERVTAGQLVLYSFEEGSGTRVYDVSGVGTPLDLIVEDEAAISWIAGGGLEINSSTVIKSAGAARKVIDAVKASDELTVESWITPANTTQSGPARIVTLSKDTGYRNFTLGQRTDTYDARLRTTETSYNGIPSLTTSNGVLTNQLTHVVYTRDVFGAINLYADGGLVASGTEGGDCSVWNNYYALALANELTGDRPWLGTYHMVAIFDRAINQAEVNQNFAAGPSLN